MSRLIDDVVVYLWERYCNDNKTDYTYARSIEENLENDLKKILSEKDFQNTVEEKLSGIAGAYEFLGFKNGFDYAMKLRNELDDFKYK